MSNIHETIIEKELKKEGACLSSDLIKCINKKDPLCRKENARQIISRMKKAGKIKSSFPITFGNNQYAYFSNDQDFGYTTLKNLIKNNKQSLFRVIQALKRANGMLTKQELINIAGCTINGSGHSNEYKDIIKDLNALSMINEATYKNIEFIYFKNIENEISAFENKIIELERKTIAINSIVSWLKKINLVRKEDTVLFSGIKNNYLYLKNSTTWDIFAFSNTVGVCQKDSTPTIVVIDFKFAQPYEDIDFQGFKKRVDILIHSTLKSTRKVLPIIVCNHIQPYTISTIKNSDFMFLDINSILGSNFENVVNKFHNIEKSFKESDIIKIEELNQTLELMKTVNEENIGNLKGKLFEYLMYEVFIKIYNTKDDKVTHSKEFKIDGKTYECDILIENATEIICVELKGYKKESIIYLGKYNNISYEYPKDTVNWFINRTVKCYQQMYKNTDKKVKFCYITTANFDNDALNFFEKQRKMVPDKIKCYYDGSSLISLLKLSQNTCKKEIETIEKFYLK